MRLANYFQDVLHGAFNEPPHWLSKILSLCPLVQGENTVVDQKKLLRLTGVNDGFSSKLTLLECLGHWQVSSCGRTQCRRFNFHREHKRRADAPKPQPHCTLAH